VLRSSAHGSVGLIGQDPGCAPQCCCRSLLDYTDQHAIEQVGLYLTRAGALIA
jgi:hypothetical protein